MADRPRATAPPIARSLRITFPPNWIPSCSVRAQARRCEGASGRLQGRNREATGLDLTKAMARE
jgi:hypothetical protein